MALLLGAAIAFLVGLLDDVLGSRFKVGLKLAGQVLAAVVLVAGGIRTDFLYYDALNVALTLVWVVGITNAFNLLDNMDGLSAGVAFVASLVLLVNAWILGEFFISLVLVALMGSLLGLPRLQLPPGLDLPRRLRQPLHRLHPRLADAPPAVRLPRLVHPLPRPHAGAGARAADPRHRHRHLHPPARGPAHLRRRQPPPVPPPRLARHAPAARGLHHLPHRPGHRPRRGGPPPRRPRPRAPHPRAGPRGRGGGARSCSSTSGGRSPGGRSREGGPVRARRVRPGHERPRGGAGGPRGARDHPRLPRGAARADVGGRAPGGGGPRGRARS